MHRAAPPPCHMRMSTCPSLAWLLASVANWPNKLACGTLTLTCQIGESRHRWRCAFAARIRPAPQNTPPHTHREICDSHTHTPSWTSIRAGLRCIGLRAVAKPRREGAPPIEAGRYYEANNRTKLKSKRFATPSSCAREWRPHGLAPTRPRDSCTAATYVLSTPPEIPCLSTYRPSMSESRA